MKARFNSTIAGASVLLTLIGVIGKGLGFFREVLNAAYFGLSDAYEIYLVSAILPLTFNTIILYFSQNYFIPVYKKSLVSGFNDSKGFLENSLGIFLVLAVILSIVLFLLTPSIIKLYITTIDEYLLDKSKLILRLCILTIPLNAVSSILSAFLQAERRFDKPAYSHLILNILLIILIPLFANDWGVYVLPIGIVIGYLLQVIYLIIILEQKISFTNLFKFSLKKLKQASIPSLIFTFIIEIISQFHVLADRFLYDRVESGGIAALNYAGNIFMLPIVLISVALTTAIFPRLTEMVQGNDRTNLTNKLSKAFEVNLAIFVPISFIFIFEGKGIIELFFMRGAFTSEDADLTVNVFKIYSASLIFYSVYALLNKIYYSAMLVKELLFIIVIGAVIKVGLNFLLVDSLGQNGLAISSTISYIFYCIASLFIISSLLKIHITGKYIQAGLYYLLNGIFCYLIAELVISLLHFSELNFNFPKIILFCSLFVINLMLLRDPVITTLRETCRNFSTFRS